MRTCEEFATDVTALIEGRLPVGQRMSMWMHAAICKSCRLYQQQMTIVRDLASDLKTHEEPAEAQVDALAELFKSNQ